MTSRLSERVLDGLDDGRFVFGATGTPRPAAALLESYQALVADNAEAGAIAALLTNDEATVGLLLAAIAKGATLISLPLPGRGGNVDEYAAFVKAVCAANGIAAVVAEDGVCELLEAVGVPARPHSTLRAEPIATPNPEGFQLVQFTSGTTHDPKGVLLGDEVLGANVDAILQALGPSPGDVAVSWLPLSHDMGLVGMLFTSLAAAGKQWTGGGHLVLLDPIAFLRRPATWIEILHTWRGTFTAAPDFGYRMASQARPSGDLDLSRLRCAIIGGEIVRSDTLHEFTSAYEDDGLRREAVCPAYGMAEAGLAVTLTSLGELWREHTVATAELADDQLVAPSAGDRHTTLVASGVPLPGYRLDAPTDQPRVGPIRVSGPSIGVDAVSGQRLADGHGWLDTGDVGYLRDGWLYVCGRTDDYLVANGRNLYAPAIEAAVGQLAAVRTGRVAAVGLPTGEWGILAEPANDAATVNSARVLEREIRRTVVAVTAVQPDHVVLAARGELPFTPSGKLQRRQARAHLTARLDDDPSA